MTGGREVFSLLEGPPSLQLWPRVPDQGLLNSASLAASERSTAVEFWRSRDLPNYQRVEADSSAFFVMRTTRLDGTDAAKAIVGPVTSKIVISLITSSGSVLEQALLESEIARGTAHGDVARVTFKIVYAPSRGCCCDARQLLS